MREIDQMVTDLETAMKAHSVQALEANRELAESMVKSVERFSTPMYGITVTADATHTQNKSEVDVHIRSTSGGIGKVYGGEQAITKQVKDSIDSIARTAGLTGGGG